MLGPSAVFVRSGAQLTAAVDGEIVMLDPSTGDYFGLADVGARIWELCAEPQTIGGLVTVLVDEYDVDAATCENEVLEFVSQLESAGLVAVAPAS